MAVSIETDSTLRPATSRRVVAGRYLRFDVARDGEGFMMIKPEEETVSRRVNVVQNRLEELKRLVPVTSSDSQPLD